MTKVFDLYEQCVSAIKGGELIEAVSASDKEFHFQNWIQKRLDELEIQYDEPGRNTYPDFRLVQEPEGYEVKGLAWPGREKDYDSNSQVPTGLHNGRSIFYAFGRYPKDLSEYPTNSDGKREYPVVDLVICHGDFLNIDHEYEHKNKSIKGFGSYGDIMIRDRKMYVVPTPFALTEGTTGVQTLIVPASLEFDERYEVVGNLMRREADNLVVGYHFNLKNNEISADKIPNPNAGTEHSFVALRLKEQGGKAVSITTS